MPGPAITTILVGTRAGLYRWHGGTLSPLSDRSDAVSALAPLPGGRAIAATASGALLRIGPDGEVSVLAAPLGGEPITSLLGLPGSARVPTLLAGTAGGRLLESGDLGATFRRVDAPRPSPPLPLQVVGIPGHPRSALLFAAAGGGWFAADVSGTFEPWFAPESAPVLQAVPHPAESHLWIARSADRVLRSIDGARTFASAPGWPAGVRPRLLQFAGGATPRAFVVAWPRAQPPDPSDPSPLWQSSDAGQSFHPIPSRVIDPARDPSGELCAIATSRDGRGVDVVTLGTDRGELLEWRGGDRPAALLADGLPPIELLLPLPARSLLDPSTSGVYLLP